MKLLSTTQRLLILFFLALMPLIAWDDTVPTEEDEPPAEPQVFVYEVPFPERSFFDVAHFRLELISLSGADYRAQVVGHNEKGVVVLQEDAAVFGGASLFTWDSQNKALLTVQSLEITADQPLTGALWLWDEQLGFLNGVSLENKPAASLTLPYLPSDFFSWQTSFAVKGVGVGNLTTNLIFGYYDDAGLYDDKIAWEGLQNHGYYRGTPFSDIQIGTLGDEPDVRWARVHSTYDDFLISGYQNFVYFNPQSFGLQSCAVELHETGAPSGWVGFSAVEGMAFRDSFVVTNGGPEPVQVVMELHHRIRVTLEVEGEEPIEKDQVVTSPVTMVLLPRKNFQFTLPDLFPDAEGVPVSLSYTATTVPALPAEGEEPVATEPRPIYAMHIQEDMDGTEMGGHHFTFGGGARSAAWLGMTAPYDTLLEVYNTTDRFQKLDVQIYDETGERLTMLSRFLAPFESEHGFTSAFLREKVVEALRLRAQENGVEGELEIDPNAAYRLMLSLETDGTFFTKLTAFQERDFGIVNPTVQVVERPVEEPVDETPVDGETAEPDAGVTDETPAP